MTGSGTTRFAQHQAQGERGPTDNANAEFQFHRGLQKESDRTSWSTVHVVVIVSSLRS